MLKEYNLYNRYHIPLKLISMGSDPSKYILQGDVDYFTISYDDNEMSKIYSIDPEGGPFISIGNAFTTLDSTSPRVKSIYKKDKTFIIEFENDKCN